MRMNYKVLALALALIMALTCLAACGETATEATEEVVETVAAKEDRTYYLCSSHQTHPYFADSHIGLRYAAEYFQVKIVALGPEGWDTKAQAEAIEQATALNASGIITRMWDESPAEAIKAAMAAGIPVILTETCTDVNPAMAYIGLDNEQCGYDTMAELVARAGETGKVVAMGNFATGANTQQKLAGVKRYLAEKAPGWELIGEVDDNAATEDAIEAAKTVFNNYPEVTGIVGLDSSSGTGIAMAMDELGKEPGSIHAVVHDREAATLEYIASGYIDATLINKTAANEYLAILLMEDYNNGGIKNVPVSSDNAAANVNPLPENMYHTVAVIDASNVEYFYADAIPTTTTDLYNY